MWNKKNIFKRFLLLNVLVLFYCLQISVVKAQDSADIFREVNNLCSKYSGYKNPISVSVPGGGGGTVPVNVTPLVPVFINIQTVLHAILTENRAANIDEICLKAVNFATSAKNIIEKAAKEISTMASECNTDVNCQFKRIADQRILQLAKDLEDNTDGLLERESVKYIKQILDGTIATGIPNYDEVCRECIREYDANNVGLKCMSLSYQCSPENILREKIDRGLLSIGNEQAKVASEYERFGVIGTAICTRTSDGSDPSTVRWFAPECISYKRNSPIINQEALRQIVALPYNQAFSESAGFGPDASFNNISNRVRQGNLVDGDVNANFGSASGKSLNTGVGGDLTGINNNFSSTLKDSEENYKKMIANLSVVINLYEAAKIAYASTTSVCRNLPVANKSDTITKINTAKKPFEDYKKDLSTAWEKALKNIGENNIKLITQINLDLKDKMNQALLKSVYDAVYELLKVCTDFQAELDKRIAEQKAQEVAAKAAAEKAKKEAEEKKNAPQTTSTNGGGGGGN